MAECLTGTKSRVRVNTGNVRQGSGGWYYDFSFQIVSGDSATFSGGVGWSANASGVGNSGSQPISGANTYTVWSGTRGPFGWDGNGNTAAQGNSFHMNASGTSGLGGPVDCSETVYFPRVGQVPGQVSGVGASAITPLQANISWATPSRGYADINNYDLHVCADTNFNGVNCPHYNWIGSTANSKVVTGLNPGTTYYVRVRAQNADGQGAWSATYSFTTLPSDPAVLTSVTPNATGTQATVVMAPPPGISAVDSYKVEARTPGGAWTVMASGSANPSQVITGLVPGQTYEWRVSAVIGTYTSPTSTTITRTQPQPNASPGAFWNGDTTDTPSTNYTWTGTAGASTSQAQTLTGSAVGWLSGAQAVAKGAGGTAVQYQIAGSLEPNGNGGSWSVRYVQITSATGNGFRAGLNGTTGYADVTDNGRYMGSIWVSANRARSLAAMWVWYNAAGTEIGTSPGVAVALAANTPTRLTVLGTAPAGAVKGAIVATDLAGSSMMQSGDTITVDAAMGSTGVLYPYFDGATADTLQFTYDWVAAANTSPSFREAIPVAQQDPLRDPDCPPLPTPPRPPVIPDDCVVETGSWRRAWYRVDASLVPEFLSAVPTISLSTFGYGESQVRIRWYPNPDDTDPLAFDSSEWSFEQIVSYIPPCTELTIDGVSRRAWAKVGQRTGSGTGGDPYVCVPGDYPSIPADSLLRGTNNVPPTWPVLTCGFGWLISLDTPLDAPVGNLTVDAGLTVRE